MTRGMRRCLPAALLTLALLLTGCDADEPFDDSARLRVDRPTALTDEPVDVRVTGLAADQLVTLTARLRNGDSVWRSRASFRADAKGVVDLPHARPEPGGSYTGADGMGLLWSMRPLERRARWFDDPPADPRLTVHLSVSSQGRTIGDGTLTRVRQADGVRHRQLTVAEDGLAGSLYLPPDGAPKAAPVLVFGGSEGGDFARANAALLASRGHPTLSLCYFGCAGRPKHLQDIDLAYFARGARLVADQDAADPGALTVMGTSRGSEAAELLGQRYPELVRDVVVFASSAVATGGLPASGEPAGAAWTDGGKPVPGGDIPLDRVRGQILGIVGKDDALWPAESLSSDIARDHRLLVYPDAGHFVGGPPYLPEGSGDGETKDGTLIHYGGTRAGNAAAKAKGWPEVLKLLER